MMVFLQDVHDTKCLPDAKHKQNSTQLVFSEVLRHHRTTTFATFAKQLESHYAAALDMYRIHIGHKVFS